MPSIRHLCQLHNVSPATVVAAYLSLETETLIEARERSGYFVVQQRGRAGRTNESPSYSPVDVEVSPLVTEILRNDDATLVPFGLSTVGPELLPVDKMNQAIKRAIARDPRHSATYGTPAGLPKLRRLLARQMISCGVECSAEDVLVTAGGIDSLTIALRAIAHPGDVVVVESPTYFAVVQTIAALGLRAVEVPSHPRRGVDLSALEYETRRHRAKAAIVMTTCHNPLGSVMTDGAKQSLVDLMAKLHVPLIEDDVYAELAHSEERPRPAKAFDTAGNVVLCSSVSKTLAPGLRVGWMLPGRYLARAELVKSVTSRITSALPQIGLAELFETGFYPRYIRKIRKRIGAQAAQYRAAVRDLFPAGSAVTRPLGGTVLWIRLPPRIDGTRIYYQALAKGIAILPGEIFSLHGHHRQFVRLSCAHPWSSRIEQGLVDLAALIRSKR